MPNDEVVDLFSPTLNLPPLTQYASQVGKYRWLTRSATAGCRLSYMGRMQFGDRVLEMLGLQVALSDWTARVSVWWDGNVMYMAPPRKWLGRVYVYRKISKHNGYIPVIQHKPSNWQKASGKTPASYEKYPWFFEGRQHGMDIRYKPMLIRLGTPLKDPDSDSEVREIIRFTPVTGAWEDTKVAYELNCREAGRERGRKAREGKGKSDPEGSREDEPNGGAVL